MLDIKTLKSMIQINDADISDSELKKLLEYVVHNAGYSFKLADNYVDRIITSYHEKCSYLEENYVLGKLDTFLRSACLMISCLTEGIFTSEAYSNEVEIANCSIGVDIALSLAQVPYVYRRESFSDQFKYRECDFQDAFMNDPSFLRDRRQMLIDSLLYTKKASSIIDFSEHLHLLYQVALITQYRGLSYAMNLTDEQLENDQESSKKSKWTKIKSIFTKSI